MKKYLMMVAFLTMGMTFALTSCGSDDDNDLKGKDTSKINEDDAAELDFEGTYGGAWANYMTVVSNLLKQDATTLYNDWATSYNGGESYASLFKSHNNDEYVSAINCIETLLDGCTDIASEVGSAKIGDPYNLYVSGKTTEALYAVESWYSWHSRDDYSNNIRSIRNAYYGSRDGKVNANSISALVASKDAEKDAKAKELIQGAIDAILAIPQPFRNNINSKEAAAAMEACADLEDFIDNNLKPFMQTNFSEDSRLDAVINQYVDAVVVPTYKDLMEKNTALDEAVKAFKKNPSNAAFTACANAWLEAREPWESSEAFLFGPVADKGLDPNMDSWPLDQAGIVNILKSQNFNDLNWSGEYNEEDDKIAASQELRGFHTLEYLIFKDGKARTVK